MTGLPQNIIYAKAYLIPCENLRSALDHVHGSQVSKPPHTSSVLCLFQNWVRERKGKKM